MRKNGSTLASNIICSGSDQKKKNTVGLVYLKFVLDRFHR
uniref:Uncharacterized protein n=1 Tax=Lepeophtheirus salmonis TaxID=72036 RepID=A0A0K2TAH5_LEPSM